MTDTLPGWHNARDDIRANTFPRAWAMAPSHLDLFWRPATKQLGIRLPNLESPPDVNLQNVRVEAADEGGWEVSVSDPELHGAIYGLASSVTACLSDGMDDQEAIERSIGWFRLLTQPTKQLTREGEIGLFGELRMLELLLDNGSPARTSDAWVDRSKDFTLEEAHVEVKTTASEKRIHKIGSLEQLTEDREHQVIVASLRLSEAGAGMGETLSDYAKRLLPRFGQGALMMSVRERLHARGCRIDRPSEVAWSIAGDFEFCPVAAEEFPVLSTAAVRGLLGNASDRLRNVTYEVDVTGLGEAVGSSLADRLLSKGVVSD